jgi:hypothetical protein
MKRLFAVVILVSAATLATAAEPVGVAKRDAASASAPERSTKAVSPAPPRKKSVTAQSSLFSVTALTALPAPGVLYPDLVPRSMSFLGSCTWNEAAGETCESKCPPTSVDLRFGTQNVSNRALTGTGKVKVVAKASGQLLREYTFDGLASQAQFLPAAIRRQIVWCHTGTSVGPAPPPTHDLIVETAANEVDKNNNRKEFHVGPTDQLLLP